MTRRHQRIVLSPGDRYGRLTVVGEVERYRSPAGWLARQALMRCDCGSETVVQLANLRSGRTVSCGCYNAELLVQPRTHGMKNTAEHKTWRLPRVSWNFGERAPCCAS